MEGKMVKFYSQVKRLKEYYEEIETFRGDNFNIFSLLKIETKEEVLHTPFIADLLNPYGSHKQGIVFLEKFIMVLNAEFEEKIKLDFSSSKVYAEKYIGKISKDKEHGGRIDILITDGINSIVIENKIFAPDQEKQLIRYYNYSQKQLTLLYLNLHGTQPNEISIEGRLKQGEDFYIISYKHHMLNWLENCKRNVVDLPIIRESLNQYINLIKSICGISTNSKFELNMKELIKENFELSIEIASRFEDVKFELIEDFRNELIEFINNHLISSLYQYEVGKVEKIEDRYSKIYIRESNESQIMFVVESFSGIGNFNGDLICGVLTMWDFLNESQQKMLIENETKGWFPKKVILGENMKTYHSLKKIAKKETRSLLVESIGNQIIEFILENEDFVQELKNKINSND